MDRYSQEWNAHYVDILIPNIIWTIVCFILGFVGNSFVLLFYICRIKRQHREDRYFIPILTFTDLAANLFSTMHYIIEYFYLVTFPSSQLCTALFFSKFFHVWCINPLFTCNWYSKIFECMQTTWFSHDLILEKSCYYCDNVCRHQLLNTNTFRSWKQDCGVDIQ